MKAKYNLLVIDDESSVLSLFNTLSLTMRDINIFTVSSLSDAIPVISKSLINLVILPDILPGINVYKVIDELLTYPNTACAYYILMFNEKSQLHDRVKAYSSGVQDFFFKPFDLKEIELLITSKINFFKKNKKFFGGQAENLFRTGDFVLDKNMKKVLVKGREIVLTGFEYSLLKFFMANPEKVLSINEISVNIWENNDKPTRDSARALIYKLRVKIEDNYKVPYYLVNAKSSGYIFLPEGNKNQD
jgi:DNA-binding response OmpR family regulator